MESEYARTDTLAPTTVAAMYATYGVYIAALTGAGTRRIWPVSIPARPSQFLGTTLILAGGGATLAGARPFGAGKQISGISAGELHTAGIYRYSRNPQYLGIGLAATGAAIATRSAFASVLAAGVWVAYCRWVPTEEDHLARTFGIEYTTYQADTARWIGSPGPVSGSRRPAQ